VVNHSIDRCPLLNEEIAQYTGDEARPMDHERKPLDVSRVPYNNKPEILKYAVEMRKFEIERFWHRSLFFWGFIGAAFVAYSQTAGKADSLTPQNVTQFLVACFGLVCSVAWTLQNRGSKYWQEAWEAKVESVEWDVLRVNLFSNREPRQTKGFWGAQPFSVSRLAIALSDFTVLVWVALAANAFPAFTPRRPFVVAVISAVVTITYCAFLLRCRQSARNSLNPQRGKSF
jgi:hypothetical protein